MVDTLDQIREMYQGADELIRAKKKKNALSEAGGGQSEAARRFI